MPSNLFYAPLAGCSDYPYRRMSSKYRPGLMYCEMVKMEALVRSDEGTFRILDYDAGMHPIGAQLCGGNASIAGQAARMVEEMGFDVVDLNCGCPVDKVTKDGSGSGMLKNPRRIGDVIAEMVAAVKIPVTVKVRAGWDENHINVEEVTQIAEQAGAVAICVHGRTREQGYKGPANWDYIRRSKTVAKKILVIGNGDLFSPEAVEKMHKETHCDAFLVSRGTMGSPWIVDDIFRYFDGENVTHSFDEILQGLYEHFLEIRKYQPLRRIIVDMRRVGCWYFKKGMGAKAFREKMSRVSSLEEVEELLLRFPWDRSLFEGGGVQETCGGECDG